MSSRLTGSGATFPIINGYSSIAPGLMSVGAASQNDSTQMLQLLGQINSKVNSSIMFSPFDPKFFNAFIPISKGFGNCVNFAVTKKLYCQQNGIGPARLTLCKVPQAHLVLAVEVSGTTYILDNRNPRVLPVSLVPYEWIAWETGTGSFERVILT